jgi:very-short-patch-repair endonuclease
VPSSLEAALALHIRAAGLPEPVREYRALPPRRWRFDFAWPDRRLLVEVHGGTWARGRHTRGAGFERDREKMNAATLAGWRVLEFTGDMVDDGRAVADITEVLYASDVDTLSTMRPQEG